jgi:hypothetical protein
MRMSASNIEFTVRVDLDLPAEVVTRIERAIQSAVLMQLAAIDVAGGYSVVMHAPAEDPQPPVSPDEALAIAADKSPIRKLPELPIGAPYGLWIESVENP